MSLDTTHTSLVTTHFVVPVSSHMYPSAHGILTPTLFSVHSSRIFAFVFPVLHVSLIYVLFVVPVTVYPGVIVLSQTLLSPGPV